MVFSAGQKRQLCSVITPGHLRVKNVFFDEISQILAFSEKTWFGMHHFVLFCEKKKSMSRKKTLLFVYKVCLTLCKLLDLFKQPNKILKLRLNLSTCLLKPFVCCTEANELPSFVKVTFFLF